MAPLPLLAAFAALVPAVAVPEANLVLSRTHDGTTTIHNLTCEPTGGSHPGATLACAALDPVAGQFADLSEDGVVCTLQYDPVTVVATGTWRGETREFTAEYGNPCHAKAATGPVFDF
ncbi:SSI family serine proteinase inhibitor [Actinosynnema sp. NPDC047251]|uniref:Putative secreted protein n=1 Tax=Saccharothrix espanaensis (strain ATCC 51144 / DSM 44229 / JCM 9112 / NBRC 15066 / NRRL 15764) TaxID=1179773 RepID=K0K3C2_SACES|nr:SSI family serine proteinase inhibitor [Saccharothrix espanaensis]CCH34740.1 putative secreted protein [Saccharothrix espanaensis DSM 44229]